MNSADPATSPGLGRGPGCMSNVPLRGDIAARGVVYRFQIFLRLYEWVGESVFMGVCLWVSGCSSKSVRFFIFVTNWVFLYVCLYVFRFLYMYVDRGVSLWRCEWFWVTIYLFVSHSVCVWGFLSFWVLLDDCLVVCLILWVWIWWSSIISIWMIIIICQCQCVSVFDSLFD